MFRSRGTDSKSPKLFPGVEKHVIVNLNNARIYKKYTNITMICLR